MAAPPDEPARGGSREARERLEPISVSPPAEALRAAETWLEDTVQLAEARTDADLSMFRQALAEPRRPVDLRRPRQPVSAAAASRPQLHRPGGASSTDGTGALDSDSEMHRQRTE
jgi:hypothetical protein